MGDHQDCLALDQSGQGCLDIGFSLRVCEGGGLIKYKDGGRLQAGRGQSQSAELGRLKDAHPGR